METYRSLQARLGTWKARLLVATFLGLWLLPAFIRSSTEWAERLSLDAAQMALAPFRSPDPRLLMINIDTATLQAIPHRWPWPRNEYHRLCQQLLSADPRFLVIDILFQHLEGATASTGDLALAELFRQTRRVGLISVVEETPSPEGLQLRHFRNDKLFREAATLEGFVWGQYDVDHTIRSVTLADERLGAQSCAVQTARHLNPQLPLPQIDRQGLIRGQLAFLRGQGGIPSVSALDVLEGRVASETLKDRVLFLGVTADILHDWHKSPLGVIS
ncbi:MAG TPA: CHASE2 domain-containing protein, partial [Candidatus Ozemobacteraceae bacterium]|nr:CHASE2 domain-containing protein [Candidatus Ozemobacteraceae bacterium]